MSISVPQGRLSVFLHDSDQGSERSNAEKLRVGAGVMILRDWFQPVFGGEGRDDVWVSSSVVLLCGHGHSHTGHRAQFICHFRV